jgi:hypothetical protein
MTEQFFLALALLALACREGRRIKQPIPTLEKKQQSPKRFVKLPQREKPINKR